jgi:hypothetical protein
MEDPDWSAEMDTDMGFEHRRLEHGGQVPSKPEAFCIALMQALRYAPMPQIEEAA